jgi:hypothetical protein
MRSLRKQSESGPGRQPGGDGVPGPHTLHGSRRNSTILAAGIVAVYVYERLGGWRHMTSLRMPARRNVLGPEGAPAPIQPKFTQPQARAQRLVPMGR